MRIAEWEDYELLDCSRGERLERFGKVILIRPDPQIIWDSGAADPMWKKADARYIRSSSGGGRWEIYTELPESWEINRRGLTFRLKAMGFKHTGIFPEQAVNWDLAEEMIGSAGRPVKILNLFAYTGAATLACLRAGAHVTHVDASKGMVQWARENARASGLEELPARWLVDDCLKFVRREARRGNTYDGIIMDPPSYGRGPGGEIWKLEEQLFPFLQECLPIISGKPLFMILNSYTTGLSPSVMKYLLELVLKKRFDGAAEADEIGLPVAASGQVLPCGSTAVFCFGS